MTAAAEPLGASDSTASHPGTPPPVLSGGWPFLGHLLELRRDPLSLMNRLRAECGEIGEFRLAGHRIVLLTGEEAQEAFFRAPDEQLDQAAAYPVHDADLRRGRGLRRDARAAQAGHAQPVPARHPVHARPCGEASQAKSSGMTADWGEQRGDRPPRLPGRAHALHLHAPAWSGPQFREELEREDSCSSSWTWRSGTDALRLREPLPAASLVACPGPRAPRTRLPDRGRLRAP